MDKKTVFLDMQKTLKELSELMKKCNDMANELTHQLQDHIHTQNEVSVKDEDFSVHEENRSLQVEASSSSNMGENDPSASDFSQASIYCSVELNDPEEDEDSVEFIDSYRRSPVVVKQEVTGTPCQLDTQKDMSSERAVVVRDPPYLVKERRFLNAAARGEEETLNILFREGINPNISDGDTKKNALHLAAENKHESCFKLLLGMCAIKVLNAKDAEGRTPLHWVCINNLVTCVKLLTLNPKILQVNAKDKNKKTPLHYAAEKNSVECVTQLLLVPGIKKKEVDSSSRIPADLTTSVEIKLMLK